jgi:hypothetical protein
MAQLLAGTEEIHAVTPHASKLNPPMFQEKKIHVFVARVRAFSLL